VAVRPAVTTVKRFELARFHDHITEWEQQEYMEIY
jgi:hypothetical protein